MDAANVASTGLQVSGGFYLHPHEVAASFNHHVVARRISPGLSQAKALFGGSGHKLELGPFAPPFAILYMIFGSLAQFHKANKKRGLERPRPFL
jgi:hypothetical protein